MINLTFFYRVYIFIFQVKEGDLITLLNVYSAYKKHGASRHWCFQHFLGHRALARAAEIRTRMEKLLTKFEIPMRSSEG